MVPIAAAPTGRGVSSSTLKRAAAALWDEGVARQRAGDAASALVSFRRAGAVMPNARVVRRVEQLERIVAARNADATVIPIAGPPSVTNARAPHVNRQQGSRARQTAATSTIPWVPWEGPSSYKQSGGGYGAIAKDPLTPAYHAYHARGGNVPDQVCEAWVTFLCCFWPVGMFALFHAYEAREALARGDRAGAWRASNRAKTFWQIGFCLGILSIVTVTILLTR